MSIRTDIELIYTLHDILNELRKRNIKQCDVKDLDNNKYEKISNLLYEFQKNDNLSILNLSITEKNIYEDSLENHHC